LIAQPKITLLLHALLMVSTLISAPASRAATAAVPSATNAVSIAETNATPVPTTEIASQAESTLSSLRAVESEAASDPGMQTIQQQLPEVTDEIGARSEETARILAHSTSLELFGRLESSWLALNQEFLEWKRGINRHATQLQDQLRHLESMAQSWQLTRQAQKPGAVPKELLDRVATVQTEIGKAHERVSQAFAEALMMQNRLTEQETRVRESLAAIEQARRQVMLHLFVRDSPPLWSSELRAVTPQNLTAQSQNSLARQWTELRSFVVRKPEVFLVQACFGVVLAFLLARAHRKLTILSFTNDALEPSVRRLGAPVSTALLLSLAASPWIYSDAPRLLWSIIGSVAVIPALIVLRRLLGSRFLGPLGVLAWLYLADQLRTVAASQHTLWRFLFLLELALALGYILLFLARRGTDLDVEGVRHAKVLRSVLRMAAGLLALALVANGIGYERLSSIVGNTTVSAAYVGVVLLAATQAADALLMVLFNTPPLRNLTSVRSHAGLIISWVERLLRWTCLGVWSLYLLDRLALREWIALTALNAVHARITLGTLTFTFGHILLFCAVLWGAFVVSRILRFVLEHEIYPHVRMAPGLNYSISKTLHYVVLLLGFLVALAMLGFDLTKLTILAGAFGVGLGFGMQNVVSNFVSGIILLFERPVKVSDVIQFDGTEGVVKRIGMRASILRAANGSEIIVPNAKLISDPVTNWTFSQRRRLLTMPIAVASDIEPKRVMDILRRVAGGHPSIAKDGPVQILLTNLNNGTASYELRAWTEQSENWEQVRSDLLILVKNSLATEKISMR
jgi:small-conductance mechanosensitive channel